MGMAWMGYIVGGREEALKFKAMLEQWKKDKKLSNARDSREVINSRSNDRDSREDMLNRLQSRKNTNEINDTAITEKQEEKKPVRPYKLSDNELSKFVVGGRKGRR